MGTILALDLGKFKTVACWYDVGSGQARFQSTLSNRAELRQLITARAVDLVVFEACTLAGWVFDLCGDLKVKAQVANTNGEAWKWKNVKRKTDRDDALRLAQLAALGELPSVRLPAKSRPAAQAAGRVRLDHAALQRLGRAASRAPEQGATHAEETSSGGAGAETAGAHVGDAA